MWYVVWWKMKVKHWLCVHDHDADLAKSMASDVGGKAVWINHAKVQEVRRDVADR